MIPTTSLRALIVDDEAPARDELAWLLEQTGWPVEIAGAASGAPEAAAMLESAAPIDLILLDVEMPGVDGVRWAEAIARRPEAPAIVFVTAYDEHALDAFEVDAVDYLLKPVRAERLVRALERVWARKASAERAESAPQREYLSRLSVEERGGYRVVPVDEIIYAESVNGVTLLHTERGRLLSDFSLKFLATNLNPDHFFRCHRSCIVRIDRITSMTPSGAGTYRLTLAGVEGQGAPLARARAAELKSLIPWSASVVDDAD